MIHCGDITKINGADVPVVDTIIFGAPCQDLSVAGKRAGMKHGDLGDEETTRSGLFMEAVRIIKEMREQDERNGRTGVNVRPRYGVYENVPGAFSSNKGEDFRIVLEELAKIADKDAVIPMPDKGKWTTCGCIMGNGWSIAWRVLDAQFWGVPQRRRRIALVADFGGQSAYEILFVRESVSGHTDESQPQGKEAASDASRGVGADDRIGANKSGNFIDVELEVAVRKYPVDCKLICECLRDYKAASKISNKDIAEVLNVPLTKVEHWFRQDSSFAIPDPDIWFKLKKYLGIDTDEFDEAITTFEVKAGNYDMRNRIHTSDVAPTLACGCGNNLYLLRDKRSDPATYVVENHPADSRVNIDYSGKVQTLTSRMGTGGGNVPMVMQCFSKSKRAQSATDNETWVESNTTNTLNAFDVGDVRTTEVIIALDRASYNQGKNAQFDFEVSDKGVNSPLLAKGPGAVRYTIDEKCANTYVWEEQANTLAARDYKQPQTVVTAYGFDPSATRDVGQYFLEEKGNVLVNGTCPGHHNGVVVAVDCRNGTEDAVNGALQSNAAHSLNGNNVVRTRYIVRRLTPLECERLQGYPDGWTDIGEWTDSNGKKRQTSDAARYKALGNSIALPPWKWVLKRICACYERDATMASLFDGIGGFPLLWEQLNGKGSCLWASEIEEFPVAVTKARIGE